MTVREIHIKNREKLIRFFAEEDTVLTVFVFGSHGTEYERKKSDIDLAILFTDKQSLLNELYLAAEIERIIKKEVDLLPLNKTNILMKYKVLKNGEKIYERDEIKTADFLEITLKQYFDFGVKLKQFKRDFCHSLVKED